MRKLIKAIRAIVPDINHRIQISNRVPVRSTGALNLADFKAERAIGGKPDKWAIWGFAKDHT